MVDHMFVQGVQFIITISHHLKFRIVEALQYVHKKGTKKQDMLNGLNKVINLYKSRGLEVKIIHGDNEFECLREELRPIALNIAAADEHVSMIERSIRTIKECTRSQIQFLPYIKYPRNMIIGCVVFSIKSLNIEIGMCKLSSDYSPHTLVTGQPPQTYEEMTILSFGDYTEVYAANNVINNNEEGTTSAVALYPSSNSQGGWMFMSLSIGRILHRKQWKKLPISKKVIGKVEELRNKEKQGFISSNFKYKWKVMNEDNHEETSIVMDEDNDNNMDGDESIVKSVSEFHGIADKVNEMINDEQDEEIITVTSNSVNEDERSEGKLSANDAPNMNIMSETVPSTTWTEEDGTDDDHNQDDVIVTSHQVKGEPDDVNYPATTEIELNDDQHQEGNATDDVDHSDDDNDDASNITHQRYNLRAHKRTDYKNLHWHGEVQLLQLQEKWVKEHKESEGTNKIKVKNNDLHRRIISTTFTQISKEDKYAQVSVSEGIKRHGEKAVMAVLSEYA